MLHRFEVENFYSIRSPQVIDLRAAASAPVSERLVPIWKDATERASKVVALFGANASGKSNVLRAISFLAWFTKESFRLGPEDLLPYQRFQDEESMGSPTRLAACFSGPADLQRLEDPEGPQCKYCYEVSFGAPAGQAPKVISESLKYWPSAAGRQVRLFERTSEGTVAAGKAFGLTGYRQALEKVLRPNASVISTLAQLEHPPAKMLWHVADTVGSNILLEKIDVTNEAVTRLYAENPELLKRLNQDLQRLGLGVRAMTVQQGPRGPVALYQHEGLSGPLMAHAESHGTRLFVAIFPLIARALENGGIAVIDELDLAIHPLALPEIIRWFHDPERNPHDAQLWMSCQNASLLEGLSKEEVLFCDKDYRGRTSIYALNDVHAVRRDDNYYRKYLSGVYGAVPRLG